MKKTETKKASTFIVESDFYSKDSPKVKYERGKNVSHLPKDRLEKLVERGVVSERFV